MSATLADDVRVYTSGAALRQLLASIVNKRIVQ